MSVPEPRRFEAELEKDGEEGVRQKLAYGAYSLGKRPLVESWLRKKTEEKQALIQNREATHKVAEIGIARSAKNAAWVAAAAAVISVVISLVAIAVSLKVL